MDVSAAGAGISLLYEKSAAAGILHENIFNQHSEIFLTADIQRIISCDESVSMIIHQNFRQGKIELTIKQTEIQFIIQYILDLSVVQCRSNLHCEPVGDVITDVRHPLLEQITAEIMDRNFPVMQQQIQVVVQNSWQRLPFRILQDLNHHLSPGAFEDLSHNNK